MQPFHVTDLPSPRPDKKGWPWTDNSRTRPLTRDNKLVWPRISIVTPSFNQASFLEETLRSVLLQGYPNLEYILIDGGSNDGSLEIIAQYAPFLNYWISERDRGQAHAINKGLLRSTGAIMGWLNSDDMLMPNALFHIAHAFMTDSNTKLVCGLRKVVDGQSRFKRNWVRDRPTDFCVRKECVIAQETTYWRRELWEDVGPLDEEMQFALDYEYWQRLVHAGYHFRLLPHYTGIFRQHETSKTSTLFLVQTADLAIIYERYLQEDGIRLVNGGLPLELGIAWLSRYQVIQQLCQTHLFDSPHVAIAAIYFLNMPFVQILFTLRFYYRQYQARFRAQGKKNWRTALESLKSATLKSIHWLGRVIWARAKLGMPLSRIEGDAHLKRAEGLQRLPTAIATGTMPAPVDGIFVRSGWFSLEFYQDLVFRWIHNDAEIVITAPSGTHDTLYVTIALGPSYPEPKLNLQVLDSRKQLIAVFSIENSATIAIPLVLTAKQNCAIVLHACQTARPLANDPRILTMQVSRIAWTPPAASLPIPSTVVWASPLDRPQQSIRLAFDQPINGSGWCVPEYGPNGWTIWTDSKESLLNAWLLHSQTYDIQFRIVGALQSEVVKTLALRVNGQSIAIEMNIDTQGALIFHGIIPAAVVALNCRNTVFAFNVDQVYSPKLLGLNDDTRFLGLNFNWLEIKPVSASTNERSAAEAL